MRILIVEDEKKMAVVLKKGLEADNHRVSLAFDGRSGLELASTTEFDVVVLDLMLPVIDGFEVARRLRRNDNRTPILMLTARDAVPDIVKGLDVGADDYLTKPFCVRSFLGALAFGCPRLIQDRRNQHLHISIQRLLRIQQGLTLAPS
jgi:DNA-binding response OmpR family regulator